MARGPDRGREKQGSGLGDLGEAGGEVARLVIDYVKQETLDPIKGLGRYLVFGVAGAVALAIGLVILGIALLRLLQGETDGTFAGNLSWVPYVICTIVILLVAVAAVAAVVRSAGRSAAATRARR